MSDEQLKAKLVKIISGDATVPERITDKIVSQIGHAYIDAGYVRPTTAFTTYHGHSGIDMRDNSGKQLAVMTGREFWNRFNEEFDKLTPAVKLGKLTERGRGIECAKKAAGLSDE